MPAINPSPKAMPHDSPSPNNDLRSTETLMPQVYDALRLLATQRMKQRPTQTISGTELVHEVYLRLSKEGQGPKWASRAQFFSAAAEAMRRILIDRIRAKNRAKRGGGKSAVSTENIPELAADDDRQLLIINEALDTLADADPASADLVKMRFFAGMTLEEIAEIQEVSARTLTRQWAYAKAWLNEHLSE